MAGPPNVQASVNAWQYFHCAGIATNLICPTNPNAILHAITINTGLAAGIITVYDGTVAQNKVVAVIDTTAVAGPSYIFDVQLTQGLTVVISGAAVDCTVAYQG